MFRATAMRTLYVDELERLNSCARAGRRLAIPSCPKHPLAWRRWCRVTDAGAHPQLVHVRAASRRRALLALEFAGMLDFDDPALRWRRIFSELLGTFLFVDGASAGTVDAVGHGMIEPHSSSRTPLMMAIILFMGAAVPAPT